MKLKFTIGLAAATEPFNIFWLEDFLHPECYEGYAAVKAAGIEWNCGENGTVAIWPKGGHRQTPTVPIISPRTGQVGYPAFAQLGIKVRTLFNPAIVHGSQIKIEGSYFYN